MLIISLGAFRGINDDAKLPTLNQALDPAAVEWHLSHCIPWCSRPALRSIRVISYKPGRRCLIEYAFDLPSLNGGQRTVVLLGRVRTKRHGKTGYRQLRSIWKAGFTGDSDDGISVPEPIAVVPAFRMWLQQKVDGQVATNLLAGPTGVDIAERIAMAIQKLHQAGVAAECRHSIEDELRSLEIGLSDAAAAAPGLGARLRRLTDACAQVGGMLPQPAWCGSHRDFSADHVIVANGRMFLIDLDLYCEADPGLDVGSFIGHVIEQSMRVHGDPAVLASVERAIEDRFVSLAGESVRWAVRVYSALALARHVSQSVFLDDPRNITSDLVTAAEQRLQAVAADAGHALTSRRPS